MKRITIIGISGKLGQLMAPHALALKEIGFQWRTVVFLRALNVLRNSSDSSPRSNSRN